MWYIPTGLDIWNQLLGKAPGHYVRLYEVKTEDAMPPVVYWPDQEPEFLEPAPAGAGEGKVSALLERLNEWLTLVQRGEVLRAYRVFLGLLADPTERQAVLAQLAFAGLIDVQDRMLFNRSYTTGHKSFRARATIELGGEVGWDAAHDVVYAGVPDMAVGPRWHSTYEMAANVCAEAFAGGDHALLANSGSFSAAEAEAFEDVLLHSQEPAWTHHVTGLLKAGKGPRQVLDVIQTAAAENILRTHDPKGFSMPQHAYEYCNTLRWFYDTFDHQHQVKLLYVAASFVNRASHHQANDPVNGPRPIDSHAGSGLDQGRLLAAVERSILALRPDEAVDLTAGYCALGWDREPLVGTLALAAAKLGNDPHNQELGLCLVEDYVHSTAPARDRLLLAAAHHTACHRKYGNPLEAYARFTEAMGIEA